MPLDAQTTNAIVQLGAVGVLLLFGIAAVIYVARRPAKSDESTVITAMTTLYDKQAAAAEIARTQHAQEMKMLTEKHAQEMKELIERGIKAAENNNKVMSAMTEANNNIATSTNTTSTDLTALKIAVETMVTKGSAPLQDVQQTVNRIEGKVNALPNTLGLQDKQDILNDIHELTEMVARIDAKLKTDELKKAHDSQPITPVSVPEPTGAGLN